jgi:hypothetical protein
MDKGVTALQDNALLKYGYKERVVIHYNFIYGFPREKSEQYREMIEVIPRLYHLTPPVSRSEAIITRFAPLQTNTVRFGVRTKPLHHRYYDSLFSLEFLDQTGFSLDGYAYYFERYLEFGDEMSELYAQVVSQINHWKRQHREREVTLEYVDTGTAIHIRDTRYSESPDELTLNGVQRAVYLACDSAPVRVEDVAENVIKTSRYTTLEVEHSLNDLDAARLIARDGSRVFGLAVPADVSQERLASGWKNHWISIFK